MVQVSDDLLWDKNCANIIQKCHARMQLLRIVANFGTTRYIMKKLDGVGPVDNRPSTD